MSDASDVAGARLGDIIEVRGLTSPDTHGEETEWFAHCSERRLTYQHCESCGRTVFPPRGACPTCGSLDLEVRDAAGTGTIYSFAIQRRATRPDMDDDTVIALVDLDEGFRMLTIVVAEAGDVSIGRRVALRFARCGPEDSAGDPTLVPVFVFAG
jgi:uncharacterized protein